VVSREEKETSEGRWEEDKAKTKTKEVKRPLVIAHRGASGVAPENSLAAVQKAIEAGADMVEIDLHQSHDGHFVVIHDAALQRTAKIRGRVDQKTLEELKSLDIGKWFGEPFAGERIPTLSEVFELTRGKVPLNVEIKWEEAAPGMEEKLLEEVARAGMAEEVLISSFRWEILRTLRSIHGSIRIGLLTPSWKGALGEAVRLRASALIVSRRAVRSDMMRAAHANGFPLYLYTVNDPEEMIRWVEEGVDGICTDFPERLNRLLRDLLPLC
jgi:glycerophosphoryl diester phosphodiesterase